MCAQYIVDPNITSIANFFGITINEVFSYAPRIYPYTPAPVLTKSGLKKMQYSLVPYWSKEKKVKFATYNARIETVTEKPTWREPFQRNHCLIPMLGFIESIDTGEYAGFMVEFHSNSIIVAAGIYDEWIDPNTGEILDSFAMLMTEPNPFIRAKGHDRQPIFLEEQAGLEWLNMNSSSPIMKDYLLNHQYQPALQVRKDREKVKKY